MSTELQQQTTINYIQNSVKLSVLMQKVTNHKEVDNFRINTIKKCIFQLSNNPKISVIVDCPDRDRAIWTADLFVSGPAAAKFVKNGMRFWKNSLGAISSKQYASGKLPACLDLNLQYRLLSPFSDDYTMWWIITGYDYLKRSGDKDFEHSFIKTLKNACEYLERHLVAGPVYKSSFLNYDWNWTIIRPRVSVLTNVLFFKVLKIAQEYGMLCHVNFDQFKTSLISKFWNEKQKILMDEENVTHLDANSLAIFFEITDKTKSLDILKTLKKMETDRGVLSYMGSPKSLTKWHRNLICPFAVFLYVLALKKCRFHFKASLVAKRTLSTGTKISKNHNLLTLPEFWKNDLSKISNPAKRPGEMALSYCHGWSTFGDI
jgi:hypothetical protein